MLTTAPRGTKDILPRDVEAWRYLERTMREICAQYGYLEIRTPVFEHTELFLRGIGETTDVVEKEMYTFTDRGERSLTLRPENTASAVRSYVENKMYADPAPTKLFYIGPMFRYDRPQAGRYRQFHQFGVEALGVEGPNIDAEIILLAVQILQTLGLKRFEAESKFCRLPEMQTTAQREAAGIFPAASWRDVQGLSVAFRPQSITFTGLQKSARSGAGCWCAKPGGMSVRGMQNTF